MKTRFALVDCNNFYASCERVFNPRLIGRPVVVLSNNDGCVIARSEETKLLGIAMGAPAFQNEEIFRRHGVLVLSSNYTLYGDMSARVMTTLRPLATSMEVYSIDEAFLGLEPWQGEPYCRELRAKVRQWTGIPVSVGIASTKTLAKLANRIAKKTPSLQGVFDLTAALDPDAILARVPCGDVWGIGRRLATRLSAAGIQTALGLKQADMAWVRRELGVVGERTARELNGVSCLTLEEAPDPQKGIATARSFGQPIEAIEELEQALATFTARAAEKLRAGGQLAGRIQVHLETSPFRPDQPQYYPVSQTALSEPTSHTPDLIAAATALLRKIYRPGYQYRKVGVFLTELSTEGTAQLPLFGTKSGSATTRLDSLVDQLNRRYGTNTVRYGSMGFQQQWRMRQERKSRGFTTRWGELLVAKV